jgi:phospholipid transport system substrate-binding protein
LVSDKIFGIQRKGEHPMRTSMTYRGRTMTCAVLAIVIAAAFAPVTGAVAADSAPAMQTTRQLVDKALVILRDPSLTLNEKRRQLRALAEGDFDFPEMARSAMGPRWDTISAEQRADYARLFTAFIEDAYLNKIQDYSGQDIQFVTERVTGSGYAEVDTRVTKPGEDPISLTFLLRRRPKGWEIYDLVIDSISIVGSYRAQFAHLIETQGFDKLMVVMRQKQQRLAAELGSK